MLVRHVSRCDPYLAVARLGAAGAVEEVVEEFPVHGQKVVTHAVHNEVASGEVELYVSHRDVIGHADGDHVAISLFDEANVIAMSVDVR